MRVVILSGGSEIVSASLMEEFHEAGFPIAVVSLGQKSVLRNTVKGMLYAELPWPPNRSSASARLLGEQLTQWGASEAQPWPIFATEDGGLRLLLENRALFEKFLKFGYARKLKKLGGLDKGELFAFLSDHDCSDCIAPTKVIQSVSDLAPAMASLGNDCVIKPSLKPLSMQMKGMKAKAFMSRDYAHQADLEASLAKAWAISKDWIVQTRLSTPADGEAAFCAARNAKGDMVGMAAVEKWRQPRNGGTGCWVQSANHLVDSLSPCASKILDKIDFVGLCEMSFLIDSMGDWRLLELNPRAWLHVGLPKVAGMPIALEALECLLGKTPKNYKVKNHVSWVNAERLLITALSGEYGPRWMTVPQSISALARANTIAMYGTHLPYIQGRWVMRMVGKIGQRL